MFLDTLFALVKLGYLFACCRVGILSADLMAKGRWLLPCLAMSLLIFIASFGV